MPSAKVRDAERALISAAVAWWRSLCPVGWSDARHLSQPAIYIDMVTPDTKHLAGVVGYYLRAKAHARRDYVKERYAGRIQDQA